MRLPDPSGYAAGMKRSSSGSAERAGLIVVAVALAAGIAATAARLRKGSSWPSLGSARQPREQTYTCRCGARYRVSDADRHRVYWPVDASGDSPVMGDGCIQCDAPLPGGRATSVA